MNPYQFFDGYKILEGGITCLLILIVLFLLFRELFTWYWKLNRIVNLLEKIEENTRKTEIRKITEENKVEHTDALGIKN